MKNRNNDTDLSQIADILVSLNLQYLIDSFEQIWPNDPLKFSQDLEQKYHNLKDNSYFIGALQQFKHYINSRNSSTRNRYQTTHLFLDAKWVSATPEFKRLNKLLDDLLINKLYTPSMAEDIAFICLSIPQALGTYIHNTYKNPVNLSVLISLMSVVTEAAPSNKMAIKDLIMVLQKQDIPVKDISEKNVYCRGSNVKSVNSGTAKCTIDNEIFYRKKANEFYINDVEFAKNEPLLSFYNQKFIQENIGIICPTFELHQSAKNNELNFFVSSKGIPNFISARSLSAVEFRNAIFHEKTLPRLLVAMTFIWDLHSDNYGFANNQLVIVDVDNTILKSNDNLKDLHGYITLGSSILTSFEDSRMKYLNCYPSLKDIQDMKEIYQEMGKKSPPKIHPIFDMDDAVYFAILDIYIAACDKTLENTKIAYEERSFLIIEEFAKNVLEIGNKIIEQSHDGKINNSLNKMNSKLS